MSFWTKSILFMALIGVFSTSFVVAGDKPAGSRFGFSFLRKCVVNILTGGKPGVPGPEAELVEEVPVVDPEKAKAVEKIEELALMPWDAGQMQLLQSLMSVKFANDADTFLLLSMPLIAEILLRGVSSFSVHRFQSKEFRASHPELTLGYDWVDYEVNHPNGEKSFILVFHGSFSTGLDTPSSLDHINYLMIPNQPGTLAEYLIQPHMTLAPGKRLESNHIDATATKVELYEEHVADMKETHGLVEIITP